MPEGPRTLLLALLLVTAGQAGCLADDEPAEVDPASARLAASSVDEGLAELEAHRSQPLELNANQTINVVYVGLDGSLVDEDQLREQLPDVYSPNVGFSKPRPEPLRSGLRVGLDYQFHQAPQAFASDLFSRYPDWSRQAPYQYELAPEEAHFLDTYDRMYELGRADGDVHLVDAEAVESWIAENHAAYGLDFEEPEKTVFLLDAWSQHGLWKDDYYWYEFPSDQQPSAGTRSLRGFGGTNDFLFMDHSAAPNPTSDDNAELAATNVPGRGVQVGAPAPEGTAYNDPPIWHYEGEEATVGHGPYEKTVRLTDAIQHNLDVGLQLRMLPDYSGRPSYAENYHVNVLLYHDEHSIMPADDLEGVLDEERVFGALKAEVPWTNVTGSIDTYNLPDDDPGMAQALREAKAKAAGTYIPTQPVEEHVRAHEDTYDKGPEDARSLYALLFLLEGHYAFALPVVTGGISLETPEGTEWGAVSSVNDYRYVQSGQNMSAMARELERINAHELGHGFGLFHAHDGTRRTDDGYEFAVDYTWSQTRTIMSYRLIPYTADTFDRQALASAHTLENLQHTLRDTHSVYRTLDASGASEVPEGIQERLARADEHQQQARRLLEQGHPIQAVSAAIDARRAAEQALEATDASEREVTVASWTNEGVVSTGASYPHVEDETAVSPTGVKFDYRPVNVTEDVEAITVTATWNNTPDSWGDFFVGWSTNRQNPLVNQGPARYGPPVQVQGGIHDPVAEGPDDGQVTRSFTLPLEDFPLLRTLGTIYAGAGTQGNAVNGDYRVDIDLTYRDHGDGTVPEGTGGVEANTGELVERDVRVTAASLTDRPPAEAVHADPAHTPVAQGPVELPSPDG